MPEAANIAGELHVDRYLTNYSVAFIQERANFIAPRAASIIPVTKARDKYVVYPRGYFWRDEAAPRPLGGRPRSATYDIGSDNFNCEEYALEHKVDDRQRATADAPINLDENAARLLSQKHMIRAERHWATNFFATGAWTNEWTGVSSGPSTNEFLQFDQDGSDPIGIVDTAKDIVTQATGFRPNTMVIGKRVKKVFRSHPDITDRIKYTQIGLAEDRLLAQMFEMDNVLVPMGVYNAAQEGATDDFRFIVPDNAMWLGYIEPNPALDAPTAIALFAWTGLIPGETNAIGGVMERGREGLAHSDVFQMRMAWDMKKVSDDLGFYFHAAVAANA